ncbi:hypothetical protein BD413DRAFT_491359 [Trametes elegans]|nr:hypothetical protein BD413DRAFT_491359 [Trametes elegans]
MKLLLRLRSGVSTKNRSQTMTALDILVKTGKIFSVACDIYDTEPLREEAVMSMTGEALCVEFVVRNDGAAASANATHLSGVSRVPAGDSSSRTSAVYACMGLMNELGINGVSGVQVALSYTKIISQPEGSHCLTQRNVPPEPSSWYSVIRDATCCPCILVTGPHIRFHAAVFAEEFFILQPFTDHLYLGGDPDMEARIVYAAKVLKIFRDALTELREWYMQLRIDGARSASATSCPSRPTPTTATAMPCRRSNFWTVRTRGLVHGDVQRPNVAVVPREGQQLGERLIDSDRVGESGVVRYPVILNPNVDWARDVGGGKLIMVAHDRGVDEPQIPLVSRLARPHHSRRTVQSGTKHQILPNGGIRSARGNAAATRIAGYLFPTAQSPGDPGTIPDGNPSSGRIAAARLRERSADHGREPIQ